MFMQIGWGFSLFLKEYSEQKQDFILHIYFLKYCFILMVAYKQSSMY